MVIDVGSIGEVVLSLLGMGLLITIGIIGFKQSNKQHKGGDSNKK